MSNQTSWKNNIGIAKQYPITITYDDFDGEWLYESSCAKWPCLVDYSDNIIGAYDLLVNSIAMSIEMYKERGKPIPSIGTNPYEGSTLDVDALC